MLLPDELEQWRPLMETLLGKEKWQSLTYFQQMCEIVAIKATMNNTNNYL